MFEMSLKTALQKESEV